MAERHSLSASGLKYSNNGDALLSDCEATAKTSAAPVSRVVAYARTRSGLTKYDTDVCGGAHSWRIKADLFHQSAQAGYVEDGICGIVMIGELLDESMHELRTR